MYTYLVLLLHEVLFENFKNVVWRMRNFSPSNPTSAQNGNLRLKVSNTIF